MGDYIVSLYADVSVCTAYLFDTAGTLLAESSAPAPTTRRYPGWAEQDPIAVLHLVLWTTERLVATTQAQGVDVSLVKAVALTTHRDTVVSWDRVSGLPLSPLILGQDTRTAGFIEEWASSLPADFRRRTGLHFSTFSPLAKFVWLYRNLPGVRDAADAGRCCVGSLDSWLLWCLTSTSDPSAPLPLEAQGFLPFLDGVHATDVTSASRTGLFDIHSLSWDADFIEAFGLSTMTFPMVFPSSHVFGTLSETHPHILSAVGPLAGLPITSVIADQQAGLFGQLCVSPSASKVTFGDGAVVLVHTGRSPVASQHGGTTTVAIQTEGQQATYAIESVVPVCVAMLDFLRDQLGVVATAEEALRRAASVPSSAGLVLVPCFNGLFTPKWDPTCRGLVMGLTQSHTKDQLCRAAFEGVAHAVCDACEALFSDLADAALSEPEAMVIDGPLAQNAWFCQLVADFTHRDLIVPSVWQGPPLGAAYAAAIGAGLLQSSSHAAVLRSSSSRRYFPSLSEAHRAKLRRQWAAAVDKTRGWSLLV
jgi:glycerol kinase